MEKHENIMKLVDEKLGEQKSVIEHYRKKQTEWEEQSIELTTKVFQLETTVKNLEEENAKLKELNEHLKKQLNDF